VAEIKLPKIKLYDFVNPPSKNWELYRVRTKNPPWNETYPLGSYYGGKIRTYRDVAVLWLGLGAGVGSTWILTTPQKTERKHMINTRRVYGCILLFTVSHKVMVQSNRTDQSECIERQIKMVSEWALVVFRLPPCVT
jgi:hypothetical protein